MINVSLIPDFKFCFDSRRTNLRSHTKMKITNNNIKVSVFGTRESLMVKLNIFFASLFRVSTN